MVTADRFGHNDYLAIYSELLGTGPGPLWLVVGGHAAERTLPAGAVPFASMLDRRADRRPAGVDPDAPALVGFTSGTTRDPKGVVHSHRTIGFETRQLDCMFPDRWPAPDHRGPGRPFHRDAQRLPHAAAAGPARQPDRRVGPRRGAPPDGGGGARCSGGATYFLTSLLDHPDFTPEHLALMPFAGLGGSPVPVAVTQRATELGIKVFRSYGSTEHPSITGCLIDEPEVKRLTTDGQPCPGSRSGSRRTARSSAGDRTVVSATPIRR